MSPDAELTRSELDRTILDKVGFSVSDSVMAAIFDECDADQSGTVSIKELVAFIIGIQTSSKVERANFLSTKLVFSVSFWSLLMFFVALVVSLSLNIRARVRDNIGEDPINFNGMNGILFSFGCYAFVSLVSDGIAKELDLIETAKNKMLLFVRHVDGTVKGKEEMQPRDFFNLLERDGLFLPFATFMAIFRDIDKDSSGTLCFNEIKAYAEAREKRGKLSPVAFQLLVLKMCFVSVEYLLNWFWVIGSISLVFAAYKEDDWSEDAILHLNGIGCILFLFGANLQQFTQFRSVAKFLDYAEELNRAIILMVANICRRSIRSITTGGDKTDTEIEAETLKSLASKSETARDACRLLFESFDVRGVGGGSDGNLDFVELYDALTQAGFVIELDVLRSIFHAADVSGDGELQMDEFVDYILHINTNKTAWERNWGIVKAMAKTAQFWMNWVKVIGGVTLTIGNYADLSTTARMNLGLTGTLCWLITISYGIYCVGKGFADYYDSVAQSKINFKSAVDGALGPPTPAPIKRSRPIKRSSSSDSIETAATVPIYERVLI